jgi:hypothetical protein
MASRIALKVCFHSLSARETLSKSRAFSMATASPRARAVSEAISAGAKV